MERTLIIGASGQIGKQVTQLMLDDGHEVAALVRDKEKLADMSSEHLHIIEADLTDDFKHAFKDCNNVIFTAGSGGDSGADKTLLIDLWAACKAADHAKAHNIGHFVMVSSIGADSPSDGPEKMQPYLVAKHMADEHLFRSGLHFTVLRPGSLTNDEASNAFTGKRPSNKEDAVISRANVAKALVHIVTHPLKKNTVLELFDGKHSIAEVYTA